MSQDRKYKIGGYQPGKIPDDAKFHGIGRFENEQLPPRVDLRKFMTNVESQVGSSCVANAFVGAYEYLAKRSLGDAADVSRLFVYYNARKHDGAPDQDGGTQMSSAIAVLTEHGACAEEHWPNDEELIFQEPHSTAYEQAANFRIAEAEAITTDLDLWRHTLAEGHPIAFALNTFESFDDATKNRGRVPMPKPSDNVRETHGWHAMLCVGYSDKDQMFIVRNSWGPEWGDQGYCYIPYKYVIHEDFNGHDSWIIKSVTDLDFSSDVWEEGQSWFADDRSIAIYEFYVCTADADGFVEALDVLSQNYAETEEDYYFDYEEEEGDAGTIVTISSFTLTTDTPGDFLEELDALCQSYAVDENYDFNVDGAGVNASAEGSIAEDDSEEDDSEEDESDAEYSEEDEGYEEDSEEEVIEEDEAYEEDSEEDVIEEDEAYEEDSEEDVIEEDEAYEEEAYEEDSEEEEG